MTGLGMLNSRTPLTQALKGKDNSLSQQEFMSSGLIECQVCHLNNNNNNYNNNILVVTDFSALQSIQSVQI